MIYLEVGWRLGLPIAGVALPGHFIVRYLAPQGDLFIDPFHQGRLWSIEDCARQVAATYGQASPEVLHHVMAPPSKRAIIARMLRNLKYAYIERNQFERALTAVERITLVEPTNSAEIRDRGLLRARLGYLAGALEDFERYARSVADSAHLLELQQLAQSLAAQAAAGN